MGLLKMKELRKKQKESLSSMSVAGMVPENPANSLSGGNQQKIVLIKWLASNPEHFDFEQSDSWRGCGSKI